LPNAKGKWQISGQTARSLTICIFHFAIFIFQNAKFDDLVKSLKLPSIFVIPAKAGIQFFQVVANSLGSGFHRRDDLLRK
jgi:hypothetical protein